MFDKVKNKSNELSKVRDELREVQVKYSGLLSLSHQDPGWSEAKAHNLGKDMEKLQEKELQVLMELAEIKASDGFTKEMDAAEGVLDKVNKKLQSDLKKAEEKLQYMRYEIAGKILDGGDPYSLSVEIKAAKDGIALLRDALEAVSQAYQILVKIGEPIYIREKIETINQRETPTATGPRSLPQYQG